MLVTMLVFMLILLVCGGVAARALARMGRQLGRAGAELERLGCRLDDHFLPRAEAIMGQTASALRDLESVGDEARLVTRSIEGAAASLGDITVMVEDAMQPIVATAASVGIDRRRVRAIQAGLRVVFGRLSGR